MIKLAIFVALISIFIGYVLYPTDDPFKDRKVILEKNLPELNNEFYTRKNIYIPTPSGIKLHAWLYRPKKVDNPPIIVLGHGFGCPKDFSLDDFADKFAKAGFASLVFDYRGFGASEAAIWHELDASKHVQDYFAVLDFVFNQGVPDVNLKKVFIWGTSYSGGHVLTVAGTYHGKSKLAGVICQLPFVDGFITAINVIQQAPLLWTLTAPVAALKDKIRSSLGLSRHYWPIYNEKLGDLAILLTDGVTEGFEKYLKKDSSSKDFKNAVTAWSGLQFVFYWPHSYVEQIEVPVFVLIVSKDTLLPPWRTIEVTKKMKNVTLKEIPAGHFEAYKGKLFEQAVSYEIEWLKKQ